MVSVTSSIRDRFGTVWTCALVGGLASIPLTLGYYFLTGAGSEMSLNFVFVGGVVAGYMARRTSDRAVGAGLRAGVIGTLPGVVWMAPGGYETITSFAEAWSSWPAAIVVGAILVAAVVGIGVLAGVLGGALGSWLRRKRTGNPRMASAQ